LDREVNAGLDGLPSTKSQSLNGRRTKSALKKPPPTAPTTPTITRFYDTTLPRGESHYVPPPGLAQPVRRTGSPSAWEAAETLSAQAMKEVEDKARQQEELLRKTSERGEIALKKAQLEKQLSQIRNEIMEEFPQYADTMRAGGSYSSPDKGKFTAWQGGLTLGDFFHEMPFYNNYRRKEGTIFHLK
jgi:hypothetical protein